MSTCNWLDLQTLGSQPIMPKNLPEHCHTHPLVFPAKLQIHKHNHEYQYSLKESVCTQGAYGNMKLEIVENGISLPWHYTIWLKQILVEHIGECMLSKSNTNGIKESTRGYQNSNTN
jgi:hypothetical protein